MHNKKGHLLSQIQDLPETVEVNENDYVVIHNWHARHDLRRYGKYEDIKIPELKNLQSNTSYRSVYAIEQKEVVFKPVL